MTLLAINSIEELGSRAEPYTSTFCRYNGSYMHLGRYGSVRLRDSNGVRTLPYIERPKSIDDEAEQALVHTMLRNDDRVTIVEKYEEECCPTDEPNEVGSEADDTVLAPQEEGADDDDDAIAPPQGGGGSERDTGRSTKRSTGGRDTKRDGAHHHRGEEAKSAKEEEQTTWGPNEGSLQIGNRSAD